MTEKIILSDNCLEVKCSRDDVDTQSKLEEFYPITINRIKTNYKLSMHLLPEVLRSLRGIDETNIGTAPRKVQDYFYKEFFIRRGVNDLIKNGPKKSHVVNKNLTLMRHQQLGREIAEINDRFAFFYDTRTGKTPLSLAIMHDDLMKHPNNKWLVVCPLILIDNAWLPDAEEFVPDLKVVNCHASTKAKRLKKLAEEAQIYITNTQSFTNYREAFEALHFEGCIVDESSDMKSAKSKVSKSLVEFAQTVKKFYLLSGTPAPNGEYEYYMQLKAIDFYGMQPNYTRFKKRYFTNISYNPQYEKLMLRDDRKEELLSLIKEHALYVDKEDVLTTPGRVFHEVELEMPPALKKHYTNLKNKFCVELEGESTITVPSAAAKINKLNQVSSGFIIDTQAIKENKFYEESNEKEWHLLDDFRFKELMKLLDKQGVKNEQVLIWANYRAEFTMIKELLGDNCRCIYGGTTIEEKTSAIKLFKEGKIQYLVANPASADKGLTLTNAHIAIYFSLNWSYELFKQSMERIYGSIKKQPKPCDYYILIVKGTVDRVIYSDVLIGKRSASTAILDHLKGGSDERP